MVGFSCKLVGGLNALLEKARPGAHSVRQAAPSRPNSTNKATSTKKSGRLCSSQRGETLHHCHIYFKHDLAATLLSAHPIKGGE